MSEAVAQRMQRWMSDALGSDVEGIEVTIGLFLGLSLALRHPEYAQAMALINERESEAAEDRDAVPMAAIDRMVAAVPVTAEEAQGE